MFIYFSLKRKANDFVVYKLIDDEWHTYHIHLKDIESLMN